MNRDYFNKINKALDYLLDFLFPKSCLLCQREGSFLCSDCRELLEFHPINSCPFCQRFSVLGETCADCRKKKGIFLDGVFSYCYYNDLIKPLIHAYKYKNILELENVLGEMLAAVIRNIKKAEELRKLKRNIFSNFLFFYVPLHAWRLRYRGFNQSQRLMKVLFEKETFLSDSEKYSSFLQRKKFTFPQAQLEGEERAKNIKGAFLYKGLSLKKRNVFVLDDVSTSGLTLNECAKVLKKNGARRVYGIVIARKR